MTEDDYIDISPGTLIKLSCKLFWHKDKMWSDFEDHLMMVILSRRTRSHEVLEHIPPTASTYRSVYFSSQEIILLDVLMCGKEEVIRISMNDNVTIFK